MTSDECVDGGFYRVRARNFDRAVYFAGKRFVGIREKFGKQFLDTELHYDTYRGSVSPVELICLCPVQPGSEKELFDWIKEHQ